MAHRESNYIAVRSEYGKRLVLFDHYCQSDRQFSDVQDTQPRVFDTLTNKDMTQTLMTSKEKEREERKRGFVVKEYDGRMNIYYGKEPWKEENCWTCEGAGYEGWDNILPEYMPLSKELRDMKPGDGPIEVVLTPNYRLKSKKEIRSK